ncbi:hypothetical protein GCM10009716_24840 [Streptomyces sodiiphilus]|uniref:XRE family transcriptional regulator n=1 Tax=Streptomyces sodiiphilus TaxID=226217 RepID=A0ABP5AI89_9ACTN
MPKRTPNYQLKSLLNEARLTYESTARTVRAVAAEMGEGLQTNKSGVHHWVSHGAVPEEPAARCLAEALCRRLGRRITLQDLGLPSLAGGEDDRPHPQSRPAHAPRPRPLPHPRPALRGRT